MKDKNSIIKNVAVAVILVVVAVLYVVLLSYLSAKEIKASTFTIESVAYLCIAIFVPLFFILALVRTIKK